MSIQSWNFYFVKYSQILANVSKITQPLTHSSETKFATSSFVSSSYCFFYFSSLLSLPVVILATFLYSLLFSHTDLVDHLKWETEHRGLLTAAAGSANSSIKVRRPVKVKTVRVKMEKKSSGNNKLKQALKGWQFIRKEEDCFL